ncbi:hypothetical protein CPB86DRAFT_811832 [Serendipita vermifera]|nr:hypothetical protein CPB86DRAFT_811832 [Serendipita vermifera]
MANAVVYGTLSVPVKPPIASSRSLQWTPDGQLLVLGETVIYILTQEIGLKPDGDGLIGGSDVNGVRWSTTAIPLQATSHFWPEICQDWRTLCIGASDFKWSAVTYSPTGYTHVGSCLIVTLSSNLEVHVWAPKEDPYRGEWIKIQDVTKDLCKTLQGKTSDVASVLRAQIQAVSWSSQTSFKEHRNTSLLALGSRGGTVSFWHIKEGILHQVESISVSETWISHLAWATWQEEKGIAFARLACGTSSGEVQLIDIRYDPTSVEPQFIVQLSKEEPCRLDPRGITALEWIYPKGQDAILVFCKIGTVELWRTFNSANWSGCHTIQLELQTGSTASTNFGQAAGIIHLVQHDIVIVSLIDGSYHAIYDISRRPIASPPEGISISSQELTRNARSVFLVTEEKETPKPKDGSEPPKLYRNHVAKTTGAVAIGTGGTILWIHQKVFAESFDFLPDAKIKCLIVLAPLFSLSSQDDYAVNEIATCIAKPTNFLLESPLSVLQGPFVYLQQKGFLSRNKHRINNLIESDRDISGRDLMQCNISDSETTGDWMEVAQNYLTRALFANEALNKDRLKLNIANVCCRAAPTNTMSRKIQDELQIRIHTVYILSFFEMLRGIPLSIVTSSTLVRMMLAQAKLFLLQEEVQVQRIMEMNTNSGVEEQCAACGEKIEFTELDTGVCTSGHYWSENPSESVWDIAHNNPQVDVPRRPS